MDDVEDSRIPQYLGVNLVKIELKRLEEIKDLREVWPNEARDFTPWLARDDNVSLLSEAIGIDIVIEEPESPVGSFSLDLLAKEEGTNRTVVIENQIEDTNHDHLGKLITYASGKDAKVIIWVTKHAREEHRSAIEWLNNHTDEELGFFLCEVKLYRIGNSDIAVKFEVVEKPNDWVKAIKASDSLKPNHQRRLEFWKGFNEYAYADKQFSKAFRPRKPTTNAYMDFSMGSSAYHLAINQIVKRGGELTAELYIFDDKELFHTLYSHRESIESELGFPLDWRELPNKTASRIIVTKPADLEDRTLWEQDYDWIMETLLKMKKVFLKYV